MRLRAIPYPNLVQRGTVCLLLSLSLATGGFVTLVKIHSAPKKRPISYDDLPASLCSWLDQRSIGRENFIDQIAAINRKTEERELQGEYDHLIFFLLQSSRFTGQPKIEPALSAYEFTQSLVDAERSRFLAEGSNYQPPSDRVPKAVKLRIADFIKAVNKVSEDERLSYFAGLLRKTANPVPVACRTFAG